MNLEMTIDDLSEIYDKRFDTIGFEFENALHDFFYELYVNGTNVKEASSVTKGSLIDKIKAFFVNIISMMRRFVGDIKSGIEAESRANAYRKKLVSLRERAKIAHSAGVDTIEMTDYKAILKKYDEYYAELAKISNKFVKMNYKSTLDLQNDLEKFDKLVDKYESELDDVCKKTTKISTAEAIRFFDSELSGRSKVFDFIVNYIKDIETMQRDAIALADRADLLGSDVLPKKLSGIQKMVSRMSKFFKNIVVKFIVKFMIIIG